MAKNAPSQTPISTQLNCIKTKWIQKLVNPTNALWGDLVLYLLKFILSSDQFLALFRQKHITMSTSHKNLQKTEQ